MTFRNGNMSFGWAVFQSGQKEHHSAQKEQIFISQTELPAFHSMDNIPFYIHHTSLWCERLPYFALRVCAD